MPGDNGQNLQTAIDMVGNIANAINQLQTTIGGIQVGNVPEDTTNPNQSLDFINQQITLFQQLDETVNTIYSNMEYLKNDIKNQLSATIGVRDASMNMINTPKATPIEASVMFNLKKQGQFLPQQNIPYQEEGIRPQIEEPINDELKFTDSAELRDWMKQQNDSEVVREKLLNEADNEQSDVIADAVKSFFETKIEEIKLDYAEVIWDNMPNSIKRESPNVQENVMTTRYVPANAEKTVKDANEHIKQLAQAGSKKTKVFNLHKTAQAKSMENVILFGPQQVYLDPFTRQPASEWSLIERNKGFGLVVNDIWNINWEELWRKNIMDKYSKPYRDNDGNWVGGYLQKRFEVDKWVPEKNNYQLKPGEKRKDYIPEERLTEARMVAQRASKDCPYPTADKAKPFNWREASSKKKS